MTRAILFAMLLIASPLFAAESPQAIPADVGQSEDSPQSDRLESPEPTSGVEGKTILDLNTAKQMAIADNPSLQAAEARVQQAKARVRQAKSAWYPQVDLFLSATNTWLSERDYTRARRAASDPVWSQFALGTQSRLQGRFVATVGQTLNAIAGLIGGSGGATGARSGLTFTNAEIMQDFINSSLFSIYNRGAVDDSFESYRVQLIASWILFNGFERKFSIAEARFGAQEFEASYQEAQRLLLSAVAQSYHAAQLARENIRIAEADQKFNERQLKEAKARRRVGTGSLSDELNFEVRVNAARASLIKAYQDYHLSLIALAELLAIPDSEFPEATALAPLEPESLEELNPPEIESLITLAKATRPDLAGSELTVKRAEAGIGRAKAPFYPSVSLLASKDGFRSENAKFGEKDFATSVGLDVQYKLFAGGRNLAGVKEAKAFRTEAERTFEQVELAVSSEVRQAVEQLKAAQEQLVLQRANAVFVQRNRDLVEKEYAGGVGSLVRLNEAQRDLVSAEGTLATARVQLQQAWHDVHTATGETIVPYLDQGPETTIVEAEQES